MKCLRKVKLGKRALSFKVPLVIFLLLLLVNGRSKSCLFNKLSPHKIFTGMKMSMSMDISKKKKKRYSKKNLEFFVEILQNVKTVNIT